VVGTALADGCGEVVGAKLGRALGEILVVGAGVGLR